MLREKKVRLEKCNFSLHRSKLGGVHSNEAERSNAPLRSAVLSPLRYCCERANRLVQLRVAIR